MSYSPSSKLDYEKVNKHIVSWLKNKILSAGKKGGVLGLSGGLDSTVTAALLKQAFPKSSLGVILPCESSEEDIEDAYLAADNIGLKVEEVELDGVFQDLLSRLKEAEPGDEKLAEANIKPRLRMTALYYIAARRDALVVGTGNWSELTTGYFTKYGDSGVDIAPLGRLAKTEVRELGRYLDVPDKILGRKPSAGLWEGQTDESELGLSYEKLDKYILTGNADDEVQEKVEELKESNRHKLKFPPAPDREDLI